MNKSFCWLVAVMLSSSVLAQPASGPTPTGAEKATPAAESETGTKADKSKVPAKKAAKPDLESQLRSDPLQPGPAVVIASNVNVRGQARLRSEVVARVTKGQELTVIEEITLKKSGADEPSAWAKIQLPAGVRVWVNSSFINASTKKVVPRKLNARSGPGENYSVLAVLSQGTEVSELSTKGDWIQIQAPTNAYAFIAAQYLKQEPVQPPVIASSSTNITEQPEPSTVTENPVIAAAPTEVPEGATTATTPPATGSTNETATAAAEPSDIKPPVASEPSVPAAEEPPPKRIVQREGLVRATGSIQAPTAFELISPETGRPINYLFTTSPNLDLSRYKGLRIIVSGEESLDRRWKNTPLITIQRIQVIE